MFSLRDSSSASSSGTDEDSFGWWIGVEVQTAETPAVTPTASAKPAASVSSDCLSSSYSAASSSDDYALLRASQQQQRQRRQPVPSEDGAEYIELRSLGELEPDAGSNDRRPLCYTPERLIRSEDYRIVAPSPRFYPTLADLSTRSRVAGSFPTEDQVEADGKIGTARLAALLRSPERRPAACKCCCSIEYGDGEVYLRTEPSANRKQLQESTELGLGVSVDLWTYSDFSSCCDNNSQLDDDSSLKGVIKRDRWSSTTGEDIETYEDDKLSAKSTRRLSHELTYVSFEYNLAAREKQNENISDINEVVSILADLDSNPSQAQELLLEDEDRFRDAPLSNHDSLARLALAIEPDGKAPVAPRDRSTEAELEQLRDKVERLQGSNKDLYEEIMSLRRDYSKDEWKINHLSEDINKLRNEVYELRYLDDLLKLLKGELERISNRNWPFAIGHTNHGTEDINLVV